MFNLIKQSKMKLKIFISALIITVFGACSNAQFQQAMNTVLNGNISNADASNGLKEALNQGVTKGVNLLSVKDGFYKSSYKILLPAEVTNVTSKLKAVPGFSNIEEYLLEKINRGAEDAAKKAGPIFLNSIKQMSFTDAMNILMGDKNAATQYLQRTTNQALYNEFHPVIVNSLNNLGILDYWKNAVNTYNTLPFVTKMNPSLDDYVTKQALNGVFGTVEKEERAIRSNVSLRSTDLMRRVFSKQDSK